MLNKKVGGVSLAPAYYIFHLKNPKKNFSWPGQDLSVQSVDYITALRGDSRSTQVIWSAFPENPENDESGISEFRINDDATLSVEN